MTLTINLMCLFILFCLICLFMLFCFYGYIKEKKEWNNGICPHCGSKWICFDVDSRGGRMYKCETRKHYVDISYPVDNKDTI